MKVVVSVGAVGFLTGVSFKPFEAFESSVMTIAGIDFQTVYVYVLYVLHCHISYSDKPPSSQRCWAWLT